MLQQGSSSRRSLHGNDFHTLTSPSRRDSLSIPRAVDARSASTIDLFYIPDATVSRRHSTLVANRSDNNGNGAPMRQYNKPNFASFSTSSLPSTRNRPSRYDNMNMNMNMNMDMNMNNHTTSDHNAHPQYRCRPNPSRRHSLMTIPEKYSGSRYSLRSSPPTYSNPRVRKELTPFQLQRKQMKSAFQFPNGENFTPRNQIARLPPSSTFPDSPSSSSSPLTQAGVSSSTDNDSIATGTNNRSPQQTKATDANQKSESESPKAIRSNSKKISRFFRKIWSSKSSNSTDSVEENSKTKQKRKNPERVVPEPITSLDQPVEIIKQSFSTVNNHETAVPSIKDSGIVQELTALGDNNRIPVLPPPRSPNRPTLSDKRTKKLYYCSQDSSNEDIAPEEKSTVFLKRLQDEWSTVYLNKLPLTASVPSSLSTTTDAANSSFINSSISSPAPSSSSSSSLVSRGPMQSISSSPTPAPSSGSSKSKNAVKSLRFADEIYVNDTWSAADYCRCDNTFLNNFSKGKSQDITNPSTFVGNNLSSTKNISNIEIKMEVNEFKRKEMRVHQDSAKYTHYYL
ncbi:XXYS1_4_G0005180.mRNA.1.CDS.1 [Saccharomyces cerevisiae]|nr:EM14S01-3B_G0002300.mRNA.1.CDS.1 [Saccharomyces cerevisiae]CAD6622675.1 XXYS1_4_G0005180.mRNA.1.CDS.1 [Saccharomyces cerevisiae]CAI4427629.1 AMH_1a_G0015980.mRNA.1.CDS.1 [Saccharomyces cerevisiae]CAI6633670.1 AMH_1a_G0015980.mRNA.1.CDS.1 [Saccharomyces cerevisiae]